MRYAVALLCSFLVSTPAWADPLELAEFRVADALSLSPNWDGPDKGPAAAVGKNVVFVAADLKNQGINGVLNGVREAVDIIGWHLTVIDANGDEAVRIKALKDAAAAKPDGIILGGFDALKYAPWIDNVTTDGIVTIGWHAAFEPGMVPGTLLFTNVATSARQVALAAASYAVVTGQGQGGVVIFTDSAFAIAQAKSGDMAVIINNCKGCTLLAVEDLHLTDVITTMPARVKALRTLFGSRWTVTLGINDLYFDAMAMSGGAPAEMLNISAGDGSEGAFSRIRAQSGQSATVAEPLNLQGWQLIDELNRAFAKQEPSGYVPAAHLVVQENVDRAGGARNTFDPENGYRDAYRRIWKR